MLQRILFLFFILILESHILANTIQVNENFETGLPTSASTSDALVSLSSGSWIINNVFAKSDNGSTRITLNTNGYFISPAINQPVSVSFSHRASGGGKTLTVEKQINDGAWVSIGTVSPTSASAYGSSSFSIGEMGTANVKIRFKASSASIYIDDVKIEVSDMPAEPNSQAGIIVTRISGSSATFNLVAGNGLGRILVYRKSSAVEWVPVDANVYVANSMVDDFHMVISSGIDTSVVVNGLEAGEEYHFAIYEYNGDGENRNYSTLNPGRTEITTLQVASISISTANLNFGNVKIGNSEKRELSFAAKYLNTDSGSIVLYGNSYFALSTNISGPFTENITLTFQSKALSSTKVYLQFSPTELIKYSSSLTISGGGANEQKILLSGIGSNSDVKVYYLSPTGDDSNSGSFDAPIKNLQVAIEKMLPGDTLFVRGGEYYPTTMKDGTNTTVRLSAIGTADKKYCIINFLGEFPIFNFKSQPKKLGIRGIFITGNYWYIKGIHVTEAGDNGMKIEGNYNIIKSCTFSKNDDTGLQLGFGHNFADTHPGISSNNGSYCSYNDIIDCDAYLNYDSDNGGSDADGFACKMHNGKQNRFVRCRAWDNADDAWDLYETDFPVYLIECWAWGSGRQNNFVNFPYYTSFQGNGNGIKMGGNGTGGSSEGKHEAWSCIAFNCNKTGSVKGFDQNSHNGGIKLVNCLAFGNGYDFMFESAGGVREFHNNVCFGPIEIAAGAIQGKNAMLSTTAKGWTNNVCSTFSAGDFNSLSEVEAKKPRGADGSMPKGFARLKSNSVLIDKGENIANSNTELQGIDLLNKYSGVSRDLGPYESSDKDAIEPQIIINNYKDFEIKNRLNVSPNPIIKFGTIEFGVVKSGHASITIQNLQGKKIRDVYSAQVVKGADYSIPFNISTLKNGIYTIVLTINNESLVAKIVVNK